MTPIGLMIAGKIYTEHESVTLVGRRFKKKFTQRDA